MINIDGAYGEGGGQILRSALTLSILRQQPVHVYNIRAKRRKPGLRPQHLAAIRAAAQICNAHVQGDAIESLEITFTPGSAAVPGNYVFEIKHADGRPSAGAVTLLLQTVLLPLAMADGPSQVAFHGGTVVPMSPPTMYIDKVYLPVLFNMGLRAKLAHPVWGFNPVGGGELVLELPGKTRLRSLDMTVRGTLLRVEGTAFAAKLPSHIPQRMVNRSRGILRDAGIQTQIEPQHVPSPGLGTGLFLCSRYEYGPAGFLSLGEKRLPSERVAEIACEALMAHHHKGAAVDSHLADQLVLPIALAKGESCIETSTVTQHLRTNVWLVKQFGINRLELHGELDKPGVLTAHA